jgi:hypothetical protein
VNIFQLVLCEREPAAASVAGLQDLLNSTHAGHHGGPGTNGETKVQTQRLRYSHRGLSANAEAQVQPQKPKCKRRSSGTGHRGLGANVGAQVQTQPLKYKYRGQGTEA